MMMKKSWFIIFFYLFAACNIAMIIIFLFLYVLIRIYLLLMYQIPFELVWADTWKYTKAASFAGSLIAIGCWWIYYQHYRKNRNRQYKNPSPCCWDFTLQTSQLTFCLCGLLITSIKSVTWRCLRAESLQALRSACISSGSCAVSTMQPGITLTATRTTRSRTWRTG